MKKTLWIFTLFLLSLLPHSTRPSFSLPGKNRTTFMDSPFPDNRRLYEEMQLGNFIGYAAFEQAMTGFHRLEAKNKNIFTLIDFSKPSTQERLIVLDFDRRKILYTSLVAHGKNSGENYATSFSNENGSHKSSLGFYRTENTYQGRNGYSLVLEGLEEGINDRAKERAIVVHGAAYSNPAIARSSGRLGRSFGCPALPQALARPIIDTIKNGTLLFIYAEDPAYLSQSPVLSEPDTSLGKSTFQRI